MSILSKACLSKFWDCMMHKPIYVTTNTPVIECKCNQHIESLRTDQAKGMCSGFMHVLYLFVFWLFFLLQFNVPFKIISLIVGRWGETGVPRENHLTHPQAELGHGGRRTIFVRT